MYMRRLRKKLPGVRGLGPGAQVNRGVDPDGVHLPTLGTFIRDRFLMAAALILVSVVAYGTGRLVGVENTIEATAPVYQIAEQSLRQTTECTILMREHLEALMDTGVFEQTRLWLVRTAKSAEEAEQLMSGGSQP